MCSGQVLGIYLACETSRGQTAVLKMISRKDSRVMALRVREINGKIKSKDVHV